MREFTFIHSYDLPSGMKPLEFLLSSKFPQWFRTSMNRLYNITLPANMNPSKLGDRELNIYLTQTDWNRPIPEHFEIIEDSAFAACDIFAEMIYGFLQPSETINLIRVKNISGNPEIAELERNCDTPNINDYKPLPENARLEKFLISFRIIPQHLSSLESFFQNKGDRFVLISMILCRREVSMPSTFIQALITCLFYKEFSVKPEDERYLANWRKNFDDFCGELWDNDALHHYNHFQIITLSLICLLRILNLHSWNPIRRLCMLDGDFLTKLYCVAIDPTSKYMIDNLFKRFNKFRQISDYVLTST